MTCVPETAKIGLSLFKSSLAGVGGDPRIERRGIELGVPEQYLDLLEQRGVTRLAILALRAVAWTTRLN